MEKEFWKSKKFVVSALACVLPVLNLIFGWNLSAEELAPVVVPLVGYVVSQGVADFGKNAVPAKGKK